MRRSRNLPLPAGRLDYIIFVSGISTCRNSPEHKARKKIAPISKRYFSNIVKYIFHQSTIKRILLPLLSSIK